MTTETATSITLRADVRSGDLGWIVERHGVLYAEEFGWNIEFEAVVARIVGDIFTDFDPVRERIWFAEMGGRRVGCIALVAADEYTAKLRMMLLEPEARGLGLGKHLVDLCIQFARDCGYQKVVLWTQDILSTARHIYEWAGFQMINAEPGHYFGHDMVSETWELVLR